MRIVGGKFKGRKLEAPDGLETRPTSDRARESIFNILEHQDWGRKALRAQYVLDVFAGSGALGLEAFSRGAKHVTFMDQSEQALGFLRKNAKGMGSSADLNLIRVDATNPPRSLSPCALIFMDAPYKSGLTDPALESLKRQGWIDENSLCVIETSSKEKWSVPEGFEELDQRKYGAARVYFMKANASS